MKKLEVKLKRWEGEVNEILPLAGPLALTQYK